MKRIKRPSKVVQNGEHAQAHCDPAGAVAAEPGADDDSNWKKQPEGISEGLSQNERQTQRDGYERDSQAIAPQATQL